MHYQCALLVDANETPRRYIWQKYLSDVFHPSMCTLIRINIRGCRRSTKRETRAECTIIWNGMKFLVASRHGTCQLITCAELSFDRSVRAHYSATHSSLTNFAHRVVVKHHSAATVCDARCMQMCDKGVLRAC